MKEQEEKMKQREEDISTYKQKIVALEFGMEDFKKKEQSMVSRIEELEKSLREAEALAKSKNVGTKN